MYRLVNVSVNPAVRFGAPETEPGPSGEETGDELMRFSFRETCRSQVSPRAPEASSSSVRRRGIGGYVHGARVLQPASARIRRHASASRWSGSGPTALERELTVTGIASTDASGEEGVRSLREAGHEQEDDNEEEHETEDRDEGCPSALARLLELVKIMCFADERVKRAQWVE
jgi:hypothetical protein